MSTGANVNLAAAKRAKNDEFYTRIEDIEREVHHYCDQFSGKSVFLNCDDPEWSHFWRYFVANFDSLGLSRLVSTHFERYEPSYMLETRNGRETTRTPLLENGDFRSPEAMSLMSECDIVVTNPPFSLFREYIDTLIVGEKDFLVVGSMNAISYSEVWDAIRRGRMWLGRESPKLFRVPADSPEREGQEMGEDGERYQRFGNIVWFTSLDHTRRHESIPLFRVYADNPGAYPRYVNYPAVEVGKVSDIPVDYEGEMGVPISFLGRHNPEEFEIIGKSDELAERIPKERGGGSGRFYIEDGDKLRRLYERLVIRRVRR